MNQDSQDVKPVQEHLKNKWAQRNYGALSMILDNTPAALPKEEVPEIPTHLVNRRKELDKEKRENEVAELYLRNTMPSMQVLVDKTTRTPAQEATILEFNEEVAKTKARKEKNDAEEVKLQRQEERFEDKITDAIVKQETDRVAMKIGMLQDMLNVLDDSLGSRVKAHPRFAEAYAKYDPAALWNIVMTVITGGVKHDPQEAMLRTEANVTSLRQRRDESLEKYFDRAKSLRSAAIATNDAYYRSIG